MNVRVYVRGVFGVIFNNAFSGAAMLLKQNICIIFYLLIMSLVDLQLTYTVNYYRQCLLVKYF